LTKKGGKPPTTSYVTRRTNSETIPTSAQKQHNSNKVEIQAKSKKQMSINRSKGLLHTSKSIHSGNASAYPIKAYLTSKVKNLESKVYLLENKKIQSWESQRRKDPSSKGLLHTSKSIHSGNASAYPIKAYLTSKVKNLESKVYLLENKKIQSWESQRRKDPYQELENL
jgi:ATP-dependent protease ClpP protease subunit